MSASDRGLKKHSLYLDNMDGIGALLNPDRVKLNENTLSGIGRHHIEKEESVDPSFEGSVASSEAEEDSMSEDAESEAPSSVVVKKPAAKKASGFKSKESIVTEKVNLLYKLDRLERAGENVSKRYTLQDDIIEIQTEVTRLERDRSLRKSIKFQQSMLTSFTTGMEFVNNRFDPFGIQLEGWSESVHDGIDQYDDVFTELHDKYQTKSNLPPEIKLLLMLGGSAFMFHMTNSMFKSVPGMEHVMKQNPGLARDVAAATARTMAQDLPQSENPMGGGLGGLAKMFGGMMSGGAAMAPRPAHNAAEIEEIFSDISDSDSVIQEAVEQRNSLAGTVVIDDI